MLIPMPLWNRCPNCWVADDTIGYSRTSSGNEIDFSPVRVPTEEGSGLTIPIESKWVDDGWRREALVMEGRYGRGVMATKSILDLVGCLP